MGTSICSLICVRSHYSNIKQDLQMTFCDRNVTDRFHDWKKILFWLFFSWKHFHQLHLGLVFRISGNCQLDGENLTWHALMWVPLAWLQQGYITKKNIGSSSFCKGTVPNNSYRFWADLLKFDFQSQFSPSKIIRISQFFSSYLTLIFKTLCFLKWFPIFDNLPQNSIFSLSKLIFGPKSS